MTTSGLPLLATVTGVGLIGFTCLSLLAAAIVVVLLVQVGTAVKSRSRVVWTCLWNIPLAVFFGVVAVVAFDVVFCPPRVGVRQGGHIVMQMLQQAKQSAAESRVVHFAVFLDGMVEIHRDANGDGDYQGDQNAKTVDKDPVSCRTDLPDDVVFEKAPACASFQPTGFMILHPWIGCTEIPSPFPEVTAKEFDEAMRDNVARGDIILRARNRPYRYCMDLDRGAGKVRRHYFHQAEK